MNNNRARRGTCPAREWEQRTAGALLAQGRVAPACRHASTSLCRMSVRVTTPQGTKLSLHTYTLRGAGARVVHAGLSGTGHTIRVDSSPAGRGVSPLCTCCQQGCQYKVCLSLPAKVAHGAPQPTQHSATQ